MASDSRLNYFNDKIIDGIKYQVITAIADCIQKTFFITSANIGIQFLGIGYFPDNGDNYPLSHFINKLEELEYENDFMTNSRKIFDFFNDLSNENDTGQYVKGIMTGFNEDIAYVSTFNTFNNENNSQQLFNGNQVDSEGNNNPIPDDEPSAIIEIKRRIQEKEDEKWWSIGGPIDILKITSDSFEFSEKNVNVFNGSQRLLIENFQNDIDSIQGRILREPKVIPYNFG